MSTILDALKRLDEETRARDAKQVSVVMAGGATTAGGRPGRCRRYFLIGLAVVAVGAAGWWVYRGRGGQAPSPQASRPETKVVTAISKTPENLASIPQTPEGNFGQASPSSRPNVDGVAPEPVLPVPAQTPKSIPPPSSGYPDAERTETTRTPPEFFSARPSVRTRHPDPIRPVDLPAAPRAQAPEARSHQLESAVINPHKTSPGSNQKTPLSTKANANASPSTRHNPSPDFPAPQPPASRDPYAHAEPFSDDTLKVQAISWSEHPHKRIAVIDGRILREDQGVNGHQVVQIRPESVIIEKEGTYLKLAFGSR